MRSFAFPGSVRVVDKCLIKYLIQCLIYGLKKNSVANARNMNDARFEVSNWLASVGVVCPYSLRQSFVEREKIFFQT